MTAAADTYLDNKFLVYGLNWYGAANTNTLVVLDDTNEKVFGWTAETGNLDCAYTFPKPIPVTEITAGTMGGGTLVLYVSL